MKLSAWTEKVMLILAAHSNSLLKNNSLHAAPSSDSLVGMHHNINSTRVCRFVSGCLKVWPASHEPRGTITTLKYMCMVGSRC